MMEEEPAADMVRETYRIIREAMDAGRGRQRHPRRNGPKAG